MSGETKVDRPVVDRQEAYPQVNVIALVGQLQRPPQWRVLKSGEHVTNLDVKVKDWSGTTTTLPVSWFDAPASAMELNEGDTVAVVGRMRRQWYGSGGNFTDVVAIAVTPAKSAAKVRKALAQAMVLLQEAAT